MTHDWHSNESLVFDLLVHNHVRVGSRCVNRSHRLSKSRHLPAWLALGSSDNPSATNAVSPVCFVRRPVSPASVESCPSVSNTRRSNGSPEAGQPLARSTLALPCASIMHTPVSIDRGVLSIIFARIRTSSCADNKRASPTLRSLRFTVRLLLPSFSQRPTVSAWTPTMSPISTLVSPRFRSWWACRRFSSRASRDNFRASTFSSTNDIRYSLLRG